MNQSLSIIIYSHLRDLRLSDAHKHYHDEFFRENKTILPNNIFVPANYKCMKKTTRNNCAKISSLSLYGSSTFSERIYNYFPYADIF